jgi:endonuclease YncB( thermonuclease family)/biotin carboxyl carrier protein
VARSAPQYRAHVLTIPNLPSLAGLVVAVGDQVAEGEPIARYVDDEAITASREQAEAARERIPELEAETFRERARHTERLAELRQTRDEAKDRLERVRFLVERDAAPKVQLVEAEAAARRAEAAVTAEVTAWTSKLAGLERSIRDARLAVSRGERAERAEADKQWVRSPVAGVLSDVRVTSVGVRGVTLTVIILTINDGMQEVGSGQSSLWLVASGENPTTYNLQPTSYKLKEPQVDLAGPFPVTRVIDGDTIVVRLPAGSERVRLIGIDTPETVHPNRPPEPFGAEASAFMKHLLEGREVWLELDVRQRDRFGRLLAYVYVEAPDGAWTWSGRRFTQANLAIMEAGLGDILTIPPNVRYTELYVAAVRAAREAGRGMWAE